MVWLCSLIGFLVVELREWNLLFCGVLSGIGSSSIVVGCLC